MHVLKVLSNNFSLQSNYLRYALRLTVSLTLVVSLYTYFNLPNGYWAAFSVIACVFPTQGQSLYRAKHRIIGTFFGMVAAIILVHVMRSNLILIDFIIALCIFLAFYSKIYSYGLFALFSTILTVLFIILIDPGDWQVAVIRLEMTLLGAVIAILFTIYFLPYRSSDLYYRYLNDVKETLAEYYKAYFVANEAQSAITQIHLFTKLETTFLLLEDARLEYGNDISEIEYQQLYHIYETLLLIKVHQPKEVFETDLIPFWQKLKSLLIDIGILFEKYDHAKQAKLYKELSDMLQEIIYLREKAAFDLSIPTATHYNRIQMTLFIKSLIQLIENITEFHGGRIFADSNCKSHE